MAEDRVHGVPRLLPGDPQVLLKGLGNAGKDGLGSLVRVHWYVGTYGGR